MRKAAILLNNGTWRASAPSDSTEKNLLNASGLSFIQSLEDGSALYIEHKKIQDSNNPILIDITKAKANLLRPPSKPKFIGILNLTEDSFSDGRTYQKSEAGLINHAKKLIAEGATIFDVGAESTRPGAEPVPSTIQLKKIIPALEALTPLGIPISIDTQSSKVASECLANGAQIINDISGLKDPKMASVIANHNAKVIIMHMKGTPKTMQKRCKYNFLIGEICDALLEKAAYAETKGVLKKNIILDPGIGFAKTAEQCFEIIKEFSAFRSLGYSLLAGPSRKSFLSHIVDKPPAERDAATIGAACLCAAAGAEYLRLHRGRDNWDAVKIAAACFQVHSS